MCEGAEDTSVVLILLGQNVPAASQGYITTDSEISAAYFTLKEGDTGVLKTTIPQKLANAAILPKQIHKLQQYWKRVGKLWRT